MNQQVPAWVVFHVPHDSTWIPDGVRHQFVLTDEALADELLRMTDHHTLDLFTNGIPEEQIARAEVSRLVLDVERFADDADEGMSKIGMGAVYLSNHNGSALRHPITEAERNKLLLDWYEPHHKALTSKVELAIKRFGKCLVIDCHSFPSTPLPYEPVQCRDRPQFCIGTDPFHTPWPLGDHLMLTLQNAGFSTRKNSPFEGALVPSKFYKQDKRVSAVMIEVRRDIYMSEASGEKSNRFSRIAEIVRASLLDCVLSIPLPSDIDRQDL